MTIPNPSEVPSERFVEQMGNHFLMNRLGVNNTFFHIPTQSMEAQLKYDASLVGFKRVVIQYKRLHPNVPPFTGRINIDATQLLGLQNLYPKQVKPYVFLALCRHKSYSTITPLFSSGNGTKLEDEIMFVDAHSLVVTGRPYPGSLNTSLLLPVLGSQAFRLPDLANRIKNCPIGTFEHVETRRNLETSKGVGDISILCTKQPSWGT